MDLEAELIKHMGGDGLDEAIKEKIDSFHGFLTREVALRLIAKEKGLVKDEEKLCRINDIRKGDKRVSLLAAVKRIWPVATYSSGKCSRVLEIKDESGSMPLVLWNQDVELANSLHPRDIIKVRGAYEKNGELHLGYSGAIGIDSRAGFTPLDDLPEGELAHVRGFVHSIEGVDRFVSGTDTSKAFSFILSDGKTDTRCVIWGDLGRGGKLKVGDEVLIEDALINKGNIEVSAEARVLMRRPKDMILGELTRLECGDGELHAEVGGKELVLDRDNALRFLKVEAADDILLSTLVALKKDSVLNSTIAIKIEKRDGHIHVRG